MSDNSTLNAMIESGEFTINFCGHFLCDDSGESGIPALVLERAKVLECLEVASYRDGVLVELSIAGQRTIALETRLQCSECGMRLGFELAGKTLKATAACPYPNGVPFPFQAIVDVPSGRLAFEDSFVFLEEPTRNAAVASMSMLASKLGFEAWSLAGFPKAGCGNSNPSVYRLGNRLIIASFDEEKDEVPEGYKRVASIMTDCWTWQCGDFDTLRRAAEQAGQVLESKRVVEVPAGRYRVSVQSIHCEHNGPLFASIELIQE